MKLKIYVLIICFPLYAGAQQIDSVNANTGQGVKPYFIPAVFIGYGLVSLTDNNNALRRLDQSLTRSIKDNSSGFHTKIDDGLRYLPALAVYGLNFAGIKGKHSLIDATGIYLLSTGISAGLTLPIKHMANRSRPDGSDNLSFPSGHSTTAFASAEFLNQEYKDVSPLYGYAGYTVATATAVIRLYNKKHWLSDVIAGAGFGILSTKISYLLYPLLKDELFPGKSSNFILVPAYQNKSYGFMLSGTL